MKVLFQCSECHEIETITLKEHMVNLVSVVEKGSETNILQLCCSKCAQKPPSNKTAKLVGLKNE